ncbi:hypothetical protein SK128_002477 [Halocaridina rubra]|uniref:Fibronectin type-III domain-containing protein n=1 Tax=Halocaridina rubra TaxID=373956 RepID=A0AAN8ZY87_HALRR
MPSGDCSCSYECPDGSGPCSFTIESKTCCDLNPCTTFDLTVSGGGYDSTYSNITTAPPAVSESTFKVEVKDGVVNCSWSFPPFYSRSCHYKTMVEIGLPGDNTEKYEVSNNIYFFERPEKLTPCHTGKIECIVKTVGGTNGESIEEIDQTTYDEENVSLLESLILNPGNKSIDTSWNLSVDHCSRIKSFRLNWTSESNETIFMKKEDRQHLINELIPCTNYTVTLEPLNDGNITIAQPKSNQTSTHIMELDPPTNISVFDETTETLSLSWTEPLNWGPACELEAYNVSWKAVEMSLEEKFQEIPRNITTHQLTDLVPCTNYTVTVRAKNVAGLSMDGIATGATENRVLNSPASLNVENQWSTSVNISWIPHVEYGPLCKPYHYNLSVSSLDTMSVVKIMQIPANASFHKIDELVPCTNYNVAIKAMNIAGSSNETDINTATKFAVLEPPTSIDVNERETTALNITWQPPAEWGSMCTLENFRIAWYPPNLSNENSTILPAKNTTYKITNLMPCTNYTIEARAGNLAGYSSGRVIHAATEIRSIPPWNRTIICIDMKQTEDTSQVL